ncbi:hypothetical protein EYZ11_005649 [Aspergillus tanneri]|uniref:DUF6604 domain-containing protein n=1 Tax=Aspergillus tanneri TaxID=1220188 RepID=A0A4S3JJU3_9EURO|nr:hypothetical protein EYZ11_005649 [Aspergillus tanneri]
MTTYNSYTAYKRDTRHLVYWIIRASNAIIKSLLNLEDDAPSELNTTGLITVPGLLSLSKLIAKHINPIPLTIYRLFQSNPDAEIERSNASYKYFINILTEAFKALGGEDWVSKQKANSDKSEDKENLKQIIFTNKFNVLNLRETKELSEEGDEMSNGEPDKEFKPVAAPRRRQQKKKSGKGKKSRGKKVKKRQKQAGFEERNLDDVPLESYRII